LLPRVYLVAGTLEPFFLKKATRWAIALRDAGADAVITERVGSHGDAFWREEFPRMVAWAFKSLSIASRSQALPSRTWCKWRVLSEAPIHRIRWYR
jgi:hypothetical protein